MWQIIVHVNITPTETGLPPHPTDEAAFKLCSPSAHVMTSVLSGQLSNVRFDVMGKGKSVVPVRSC